MKRAASWALATGALLAWAPLAQGDPLFGPKTFRRATGAPQEIVEHFALRGDASTFKIIVRNGLPDGTRRVSSAWVTLNGEQILGPSDFNQQVAEHRRPLALLPVPNALRVRIAGAPGGQLTITVSAAIGPEGGFVETSGGARLTIPPGALDDEIALGLQDQSLADLGIALPSGYGFLGAVSVELGLAALHTEADLAIVAPDPVPARVIAARVLEDGGSRLLALVDTASARPDGLVHTDSPPFPGIRAGGSYLFVEIPNAMGILGVDVVDEAGNPLEGALVKALTVAAGPTVTPELLTQTVDGQALFVGHTDSAGFAAIPALAPDSTTVVLTSAPGFSPAEPLLGGAGPLHTPIDLPFPLSGRITSFIHRVFTGGPVPQPPGPCPCPSLVVAPPEIPFGAGPPFEPGHRVQLTVFCDGSLATPTNFFSVQQLLTLFRVGEDLRFIYYWSSPPFSTDPVVDVSDTGLVTARRPGDTSVSVRMLRIRRVSFLGVPFPQLCTSAGAVSPVVVSQRRGLQVQTLGTGAGHVQSTPAGISCPGACQASFEGASSVTLTATADAGSRFISWGGDCSGFGDAPTAILTMDGDRSCTAEFRLQRQLAVTKTGTGSGVVTSVPPGIACGSACTHGFDGGAVVALAAVPDSGSRFVGWGGDCAGSSATTSVTMGASHACTAEFARLALAFVVRTSYNFPLNAPGQQTLEPSFGVGSAGWGVRVTSATSAGPASITTTLEVGNDTCQRSNGAGAHTTIEAYWAGPPGTPFRIEYDWTGTVAAFSRTGHGIGAAIQHSSFQNISATASTVGGTDGRTAAMQDIETGVTSNATISLGGSTYSLARTYQLHGIASTNGQCFTCSNECCNCGFGSAASTLRLVGLP
jgi:hypothetical protein